MLINACVSLEHMTACLMTARIIHCVHSTTLSA